MLGERIGNYRVVRKIGDGGMGSVYEAVHESIARHVAVKVLRPLYSREPGIVARFFNEARAVNIVPHPGIVGSFDYGQLPDGTAYIVMEYVEGESLAARIKRLGRLGADALRIARQLAGTLAAAHAKGIIHRDMKPDNVILTADPEAPGGERAKILDFGIAKVANDAEQAERGGAAVSNTQTGVVMGTPKYMSPEQCKGAGQVDAKADVYSLGVILFEMLGGRLPFVAEGTGSLIAMHIYQPPPPLSEFAPGLPVAVEQLVSEMLGKEPARRPGMADVVRRLEELGARTTQATGMGAYVPPPELLFSTPQLPVSATDGSKPTIPGLASGQSEPGGHKRRSRLVRLAAPLLIVPLVFVAVLALRQGAAPPENPARGTSGPAPPRKKVVWSVKSDPPGAVLVRVADQQMLGITPWRGELLRGSGTIGVAVRRQGYKEKQIGMDLGRDCAEEVTLEAEVPRPHVPEPAATPAGAAQPVKAAPQPKLAGAAKVKPGRHGKPPAPGAAPAEPKEPKPEEVSIEPMR